MNNAKKQENNRRGKTRDHLKKTGNIKGTFHLKMDKIKNRNGKDLIEAKEIKKRWQKYTKSTVQKKYLKDRGNHDGVVTHQEPDILDGEIKWTLGRIAINKASGGD